MRKRLRQQILEFINEVLNTRTITNTAQALPIGYNPVEYIRGALFHWVAVPFNGTDIWCELRCPNATQIEQCGDMSNITVRKENEESKYSYEEIIKIRNYQEKLCQLVLNKPTFDNIAILVGDNDFVLSEKKKELERIQHIFNTNKENMTELEKSIVETQLRTIELQIGFILPDDTMAFLTKWAMGNDISDVKKITKDNFLKAASLAKAHNKAPSDYLSGVFTDFNRQEIDTYAWMVLSEFIKEQEIVNKGKYRWIGGKYKMLPPKKTGE
jgi:hypothetical protein